MKADIRTGVGASCAAVIRDATTQPAAAALVDNPRSLRLRAVADVRRSLVLAAARSAFLDLGLEGASLREIAKRAGYTPGALYSYFQSKEEVYGALLAESLERLNEHVANATGPQTGTGTGTPRGPAARRRRTTDQLRTKAMAFFEFYRENPRDLDLGFYLFHGMQPRGLTPTLNRQLNSRLRDALTPVHDALVALGQPADTAQAEVTALFAHVVGLLLLSHTGRIRMFQQESQQLFARYLDALVARIVASHRSPQP